MGVDGKTILVDNEISYTSHSAISLLCGLSGWFKHEKVIQSKILSKAESLINKSGNYIDIHFLYTGLIQMYYRDRDKDPSALEKAIEMCKRLIKIAPHVKRAMIKEYYGSTDLPRHLGFEQLAIIEEKRKNFDSAISISRNALEQGWSGNWEYRIERCLRKLNH
jgi:tetratricopeptide (TPR) repeat protein